MQVYIHEITQSKRHKERYMVFTAGGDVYKLSIDSISLLGIREGIEVDSARLLEQHQADQIKWASAAAFHYLKYRPRTEKEMRSHLIGKGYEASVIEAVLCKLDDYGYVNDAAFAKEWVKSRVEARPQGRRRLISELKQKGIEESELKNALSEYSEKDELLAAMSLAKKVQKRNAAYEVLIQKKKIANKLTYQGFDWQVIQEVLRELFSDPM